MKNVNDMLGRVKFLEQVGFNFFLMMYTYVGYTVQLDTITFSPSIL